jgi:chloramphenicol-sensitive protein RarD
MNPRRAGTIYALLAYGMWGLLPLYLRAMHAVPPLELVSHRIVWAFVFLSLVLAATRQFEWLRSLKEVNVLAGFLASAAVLSLNWFVYIWAVSSGRVVDASLGYFINPLFSVVLAVVVLKERLRVGQWLAIGLAGIGVAWLTTLARQPPWVGLALAASFGLYGLLRKTARLEALAGLTLETTLLLPAALAYLGFRAVHGTSAWGSADSGMRTLLVAAGPVTAIPLLSFAAGARRIPLSLLGVLQYLGPSLQLLLGILVFNEPFAPLKMAGFAWIWLSLLVYSWEGWRFARTSASTRQ